GSQAVVENLVALIPYFGWAKKGERIADIADGGGDNRDGNDNDDSDGDGEQQTDGDRDNEQNNGQSCTRPSSFTPGTPVPRADGTTAPIQDIATNDQEVHNLTVTDPHTYYVGTGPTDVLVRTSEAPRCTITEQVNQHIDDRHTENGRLRDPDATVWSVNREERTRLINETIAQDPEGVPNTDDRDGTIHVGEFDEPVGRAGDSQGRYPIYEVEVILYPDGSVRTAYPSGYIPDNN
ncbi:hypothetical protein ACFO4E_13820, partial [Nocardiopsis mangrovi]